jgi:hypothetical protein
MCDRVPLAGALGRAKSIQSADLLDAARSSGVIHQFTSKISK